VRSWSVWQKRSVWVGARDAAAGIFALALATVLGNAQAAEVPMDISGFTKYVSLSFAGALPGRSVTVTGPLAISIDGAGLPGRQEDLHNIYGFCLRNAEQCDQAVASHVTQMTQSFAAADMPADRSSLRALVRTSAYVEAARRVLAGKGEPIAAPLVGDLWVICGLDLPTAIKVLRPADLAELGLSRDQALTACRENVAAALRPLDSVLQNIGTNGVGTILGDPYESSRLLQPESWAPVAARAGGTLIVSVPANDAVLYAYADDKAIIESMQTLGRLVAAKANRPLSSAVFRWTPAGWEQAAP